MALQDAPRVAEFSADGGAFCGAGSVRYSMSAREPRWMRPDRSPGQASRAGTGSRVEGGCSEGAQKSAAITVGAAALADIPEALWPRLAALLSEDERVRASRFRFEPNRREFIAAHALKRLMLCEANGGAPQDWVFDADPDGKPFIINAPGPHFSLSHCDGLVACALSPDFPVGVDVEAVRPNAPLDIAERYFAASERAWLLGLPPAERARGFFELWTMKEAVIKATGKGLSQSLQSFVIGFDPLRVDFVHPDAPETREWRLAQRTVGDRGVLSLAWRGPAVPVTFRAVRFERLLSE